MHYGPFAPQVCVVQARSALCCPRCLAGEPVSLLIIIIVTELSAGDSGSDSTCVPVSGSHQTHPGSVTSQQEVPSSLPQPSNQNPLLLDGVIWPPGRTNQLPVSDVFARFI